MSVALQLPWMWGTGSSPIPWPEKKKFDEKPLAAKSGNEAGDESATSDPPIALAFYRKHTESLLRRFLYASMQVGRAPSILGDPVGRGWASSRPIRTFEDAVIFVLDIETCLSKLGSLDRELLSRVVLQQYTQDEAASMLGMSIRTVGYRFPLALDRLTEKLLEADLLLLPQ